MNYSIVRWLTVPDTWDFTDDIKPDAENAKKNRTASSFAISIWKEEPDTWKNNYEMLSKPPAIHKINLSKVNIWAGEEGLINLHCEITDEDGDDIQFKILVNNEEIIPLTGFISTPTQITESIPITRFMEEENLLELIVVDELGLEAYFSYIIRKENRDTFIFKRIFDFKEDYITDENIEVIYGKGLALKELGAGEVVLKIPTKGKSKIKSIEIDGTEDIEEELIVENEMTYIRDEGEGKVYESRTLTEYKDILDIGVEKEYSIIRQDSKYFVYEDNKFIEVEPTIDNFTRNSVDLYLLTTPNQDGIKPYTLLDNPFIVVYTEDDEVPILTQTVLAESKVRYLVSKDKETYMKYDGGWAVVDKEDILEEGMTKTELEAITEEQWMEFGTEIFKDSFEILIGLFSESPSRPLIRSVTVEYADNEPPIIIDADIEPDNIHNEFATITANVKDFEGDKISFKVKIRKAGTDDFVQVSPLEGWYNRNTYETTITQAYNYPYFNPGINQIKLVVKDERGAEAEWIGNILLSNEDPTVTITYDDFKLKAVIGDDDNDDIAYRISVNEEMVFDYTNFMPTKAAVDFIFTEYLNFGEENIVKIEVKDTHGGYASEEFTVIGTYRGLMFKNEQGEYFVDDKGEILIDLLFPTLIGGQTSDTKKVILENRHEFPLRNVDIIPENPDFVDGAVVEISETEMPFNPKNIIKILETMPVLGEKDFYVRVKTDRSAHQGGYFYIKSKATPVI